MVAPRYLLQLRVEGTGEVFCDSRGRRGMKVAFGRELRLEQRGWSARMPVLGSASRIRPRSRTVESGSAAVCGGGAVCGELHHHLACMLFCTQLPLRRLRRRRPGSFSAGVVPFGYPRRLQSRDPRILQVHGRVPVASILLEGHGRVPVAVSTADFSPPGLEDVNRSIASECKRQLACVHRWCARGGTSFGKSGGNGPNPMSKCPPTSRSLEPCLELCGLCCLNPKTMALITTKAMKTPRIASPNTEL